MDTGTVCGFSWGLTEPPSGRGQRGNSNIIYFALNTTELMMLFKALRYNNEFKGNTNRETIFDHL